MAFVPASTIFGFAYFMDGEEFSIELRQDMRNLRFQWREYVTPVQGRYDSINQTLFGYLNYKGPGFREKNSV